MSDASVGRLTPVSVGYPSALSSDDDEQVHSRFLHHSYPGLSRGTAFQPKPTSFVADNGVVSAPSLIHAGWDSCSDISDT